ncbi:hypothetical protein GCM10025858_30180 [Alicyclobacillus sacchari]|nr:hypothetical protein GCM10025858_30180 [Alicyclobacillus sacchari]
MRVTSIDPGMVETEFSIVRFHGDKSRADAVYAGMRPLTATDIADCIAFAVTRPVHVNIDDMIVTSIDQAVPRASYAGTAGNKEAFPMLVSVAELAAHAADPNWTVFDCRFRLTDPNWGKAAYDEGHIPHAHHLDLERDLSDPPQAHGGRHPLPDTNRLAKRVGECGARPDSVIVVYDGGEGMAARAWWLLRHIGARDVRMLDGGLAAWTKAGLALSTDPPAAVPLSLSRASRWMTWSM